MTYAREIWPQLSVTKWYLSSKIYVRFHLLGVLPQTSHLNSSHKTWLESWLWGSRLPRDLPVNTCNLTWRLGPMNDSTRHLALATSSQCSQSVWKIMKHRYLHTIFDNNSCTKTTWNNKKLSNRSAKTQEKMHSANTCYFYEILDEEILSVIVSVALSCTILETFNIKEYHDLEIHVRRHSPIEFVHNLYIVEFYRPGTILTPLIVCFNTVRKKIA